MALRSNESIRKFITPLLFLLISYEDSRLILKAFYTGARLEQKFSIAEFLLSLTSTVCLFTTNHSHSSLLAFSHSSLLSYCFVLATYIYM